MIAYRWVERLKLLLFAGVVAPAVMALIGLGLMYAAHHHLPDLAHWPRWQSLALGAGAAVISMAVLYVLYKSSPAFERALRDSGVRIGEEALRSAGYPVLLLVVSASGIGEEILFRGGIQAWLGLVPAALLFGFSHGGWRREMWAYAVAASVSGGLFGLAYYLTGDLWVPMAAHVLHNIAATFVLGKEAFTADDMEAIGVTSWHTPYPQRQTAREAGVIVGALPTGAHNDITDVPGVRVGHATVVSGEGALTVGQGPVRTGVTAILPHSGNLFQEKVAAGAFVLNGFGKSTGLPQLVELGTLETPIVLTNTLSVWRAADAVVSYMLERNPDIGITTGTVNPVVGECNDGYLSDIQGRHVTAEAVRAALDTADGGPVRQGAVGAGTGTVCFGFKGGIGSSSRQVGDYHLGALVQANFGRREHLLVAGRPVGQWLRDYPGEEGPEPDDVPPGSIMVVLATDAPLDSRQLSRLCRRGALGIGRVGGHAANGSGDFVVGFSPAVRVAHQAAESLSEVRLVRDDAPEMDQLFQAAVEAVEEAILNALFTAVTVTGRDGHVAHALPVVKVVQQAKQMGS